MELSLKTILNTKCRNIFCCKIKKLTNFSCASKQLRIWFPFSCMHRHLRIIECKSFVMSPLQATANNRLLFFFFCCGHLQNYWSKQGRQYEPLSSLYYLDVNGCMTFLIGTRDTYFSSLCLYFMRTVPEVTSIIHMEFPPQVATLDVVFSGWWGSGSKTTSQIWKSQSCFIEKCFIARDSSPPYFTTWWQHLLRLFKIVTFFANILLFSWFIRSYLQVLIRIII